ncbi:glycosyltransferase 87 family protein [Solwaraspora sp. WMMA2101]|uniref:glycosyltransferase 87 family protein n=1 Tax=Solwaraspora sp. WMMA2101 TaxID=3404124 RepID=UPI003B92412A
MESPRRRWLLVAAAIAWLVSRASLLAVPAGLIPGLDAGDVFADVELYRRWSDDLRTGQVPVDDPMWQYPPGAAALFVAIRHLAGDSVQAYTTVFVLFALCADLAVTLALVRLARRGGRIDGVVYWVFAVPLLTLLPYARYDIFVTAPAVVALALLVRRPVLAGVVLAVGALVKVWPAMLLIAARPLRGLRPVAVGFVVALVGLGAALTLAYTGAWSGFTGNQAGRGLQVESVAATAFAVARLVRPDLTVSYVYGSMEFLHPVASVVATVLTGTTLVALGALSWWWSTGRRRTDWTVTTGVDLALLVVLVTVVTSRVLSPQYLLWLLGLAAVCLTRRDTTQRVPAVLIVVSTALTGAYFPWFYAT